MKTYLRYSVSALTAGCLLGATLTTPALATLPQEVAEPSQSTIADENFQQWNFFPVKRGEVQTYQRVSTSNAGIDEFFLSNSPSWASVDSTGLVTVQPPADTAKGSYPITVNFVYADGSQSSFTAHVLVVGTHAESNYVAYPGRYAKLTSPTGLAPLILPRPVPPALEGTSPAPNNFSLVDAPDWVHLDPAAGMMTFTMDGSPTVGAHTFDIALTFPDGSTRTEPFTVVVGDFVAALTPFWGDEGETANQLLFTTDLPHQPAPVKWENGNPTLPGTTFEKVDGPSWVTVDEDGTLVGNPPAGSSPAEVTVKVTYPDKTSDTVNVTILTLASNTFPNPVDPLDESGNIPVNPTTVGDGNHTPSWVPAVASISAIIAAILAAIAGFFFFL